MLCSLSALRMKNGSAPRVGELVVHYGLCQAYIGPCRGGVKGSKELDGKAFSLVWPSTFSGFLGPTLFGLKRTLC